MSSPPNTPNTAGSAVSSPACSANTFTYGPHYIPEGVNPSKCSYCGKYLYVCNMGYYRCGGCGQLFCAKCADNGNVYPHLEVEETEPGVKGEAKAGIEHVEHGLQGEVTADIPKVGVWTFYEGMKLLVVKVVAWLIEFQVWYYRRE